MKTARNVVLKSLSATVERYIVYFNFLFLFAVVKIREVRTRTILISRIVRCRVDIQGEHKVFP